MQEVRTCDFCGADATGVYEPLPESVDDDGPRLLLCAACHDRLSSVVDPLLDHVGAADAAGQSLDRGDDLRTGSVVTEAEPGRTDDDAATDGEEGDGESPGNVDATPRSADEHDVDQDADATDGTDPAATPERDPGAADASGADAAGTDDGDDEEAEAPRRDLDPATTVGSSEERRGTPRGYRQVMRFLESREFPMDREEAETLAASAYDVDRGAVSAAIDHAIKYDRLREVSGELRQ